MYTQLFPYKKNKKFEKISLNINRLLNVYIIGT